MKRDIGTGGLILLGMLIWWLSHRTGPISATEKLTRMIVEIYPGSQGTRQEGFVESQIRNMGVKVETTYGDMIQILATPNQITEIMTIPGVSQVRAPMESFPF